MNQLVIDEITTLLNNPSDHPELVSVVAIWREYAGDLSTIERKHYYPAGTSTITANRKTLNEIKWYFPNAVIIAIITTEAAPK
jgi:hypothetical protein